jgi:pectate lyase
VKRREFLAAPLALVACATLGPGTGPDGWASVEGAGDIEKALGADRILEIGSRADLDAALRLGDEPKLLRVHGMIDLSNGRAAADFSDPGFDFDAYCRAFSPQAWGRRVLSGPLEEARKRSAARQASAIVAKIPPRTAIIGVTPDAGFVDGTVMIERTHGVVLRNLRFRGVRDHFPAWDPLDGAEGEWNSEYDAVSLRGGRTVWVDHCTFESRYPPKTRVFGRLFETNDGLLDITLASDLVTVSWCRFARHDKTMLIGGSDRHEADQGHLRVTLHHNLWEDCAERTPRVRFGRVHVANNLFVAPDGAHYGYSIGLGKRCRIVSEDNAWEVAPGIEETRILRNWGGTQFHDRGSIVNGRPVDLAAAFKRAYPSVALDDRPSFEPPPIAGRIPAAEVAAAVRANAGASMPR